MTEVAFHFNAPDKLAYACRFVRKALRADAGVAIVAPAEVLSRLDGMLWNMAAQDFVAHCRADADDDLVQASPALLGTDARDMPVRDVMLYLGDAVPEGYERFGRLVEIVSAADEDDRQRARMRWRHYAGAGHNLVRHDLAAARSDA